MAPARRPDGCTVERALNEALEAEGLTRVSQALAGATPRQGAGGATGAAEPSAGPGERAPGEGEIVDAEFEDIDERRAS